MKHSSIKLFIALVATVLIYGCEVSVEKRLPGTWNYQEMSESTVEYGGETFNESSTGNGIITFNEDGSGTLELNNENRTFTWSTSVDSVWITEDNATTAFVIINNEKSAQEWSAEVIEKEDNFTFTTNITVNLIQ